MDQLNTIDTYLTESNVKQIRIILLSAYFTLIPIQLKYKENEL